MACNMNRYHVERKRVAFLAMVILLASSQLAWGRRAELLQDEDAPSGELCSLPQINLSCYFSARQPRTPGPLSSSPDHSVQAFIRFCSAGLTYSAQSHVLPRLAAIDKDTDADRAAGPGFRFPTVAIPGTAALLNPGAPAAAEAPGMAKAGAPLGAIAAAPAPGLTLATIAYHIEHNQTRDRSARIMKHASCLVPAAPDGL